MMPVSFRVARHQAAIPIIDVPYIVQPLSNNSIQKCRAADAWALRTDRFQERPVCGV